MKIKFNIYYNLFNILYTSYTHLIENYYGLEADKFIYFLDILYMCFSVESSLKTTSLSLFAIVYLLSSRIPHFQWIGVGLIGWCGMQFAELLLWLTEPRKGCTLWNKIITMTLTFSKQQKKM